MNNNKKINLTEESLAKTTLNKILFEMNDSKDVLINTKSLTKCGMADVRQNWAFYLESIKKEEKLKSAYINSKNQIGRNIDYSSSTAWYEEINGEEYAIKVSLEKTGEDAKDE